jgi:hypothetical protein
MKKIFLFLLAISTISCSKTENVYLEKNDIARGEWTRVAIMFGYYDNYAACDEIKTALIDKYPQLTFRCQSNSSPITSVIIETIKN